MRNLIATLCLLLAPVVFCQPQYSVDAQIINQPQPYTHTPPPQAYTDSPDANIIAFSPERTRARVSGAASPRSQSRYNAAAAQAQPAIRPAAPEQYFVPPTPHVVAQPPAPQQYVAPQAQPQPQYREPSSRHQSTTSPPEEVSRHPHQPIPPIAILKLDKSQSLDGSYKQSWESANNIIVEETGFLKDLGVKDEKALVQQGSYTYTAPDGTVITTTYTADERGFKVEGSHLPTPPPIPEEIQKGLNQIYEGIRVQQELDAKDAKSGKVKPKDYNDDYSNSLADSFPQNYQQTTAQPAGHPHRQYQPYQAPAVQQPVQQQYQSDYQQTPDQSQLFQRQQYRQ